MSGHESPIDPMNIKDSVKMMSKKRMKDRKPPPATSKYSPVNLPGIKCTTNSSQMEEWNIKSLPSDWEPNAAPSRVVRRLLKKREDEHRRTIDDMRRQMHAINVRLEDEIRKIAETYKKDSVRHEAEVDGALDRIRIDYKQPNNLEADCFQTLAEHVQVAYRTIKNKLVKMHADFRNLELIRSDVFKKILQGAYAKANEISHRSPFDIHEYFENEIQDINAITLNNLRCYVELKMQLKLHVKNNLRLWLNEICFSKEKWAAAQRDLEFEKLNNPKQFNKDCKEIAEQNDEMIQKIIDKDDDVTLGSWSITNAGTERLVDKMDGIESICFEMDFCAQTLVGNFKEAIANVFSNYFCDLKNLSQKIVDLGLMASSEVIDVKAEMCGPVVLDMTNKFNDQYTRMQNLWSTVRQKLENFLKDTLVFIGSLAYVWDSHLLRVNEAKDAVSKDLKKTVDEGNRMIWGIESKINIAVDALRQATDENQLYEHMCEINGLLDQLTKIYETNCNKECKVTEKLLPLCVKEGEVLLAELEQFLFVFSEIDVSDSSTDDEDTFQDESLLAQEIEMCKRQIKSVVFFKEEVWNIMSKYTPTCREENLQWAKQWIASKCRKAELKLKIKLELVHVSRYGRTKPVIYDVRLAEIKEHRNRLRRHHAGVDVEITNINSIYPAYEEKYDVVVEQYGEEVRNISERNDKATNAAVVNGNVALLRLITDTYVRKIHAIDDEYHVKCQDELTRIFVSSLLYMKAIRLFSEGGSFNPIESKSMCVQLGKLRKSYNKKIADMGKNNGNKFVKSLKEIQGVETSLQSTLNKHLFEMHYNDHYTITLKNIHADVKREVFDLKLKRKILTGCIADVQEKSQEHVGVPGYIETFTQLYNKVALLCEDMHRVLSRTDPSNYAGEALVHLVTNSSTKSASVGKTNHEQKNYARYLFGTRPSKEGNFIGKVRYLIHESFERLQDSAQEFYAKHSNVEFVNGDRIHTSFGDFIVDVLPMHVYYHLQCEMVWLEETNEYIKCINDFSQYLKTYFETFLHKYIECVKIRLEKKQDAIFSQIRELEAADKNDYLKICNKLKPLHGYPGNKTMLEELNEEMEEFLKSKGGERRQPLAAQKEILASDFVGFKENVKVMIEKFELLINSFAEESFKKEILVEFEETLYYLENFVGSQSALIDDAVATRASERLGDYKVKVGIPAEYYVNLSASFVSLSRIYDDAKSMFDVDAVIECYERTIEKIGSEIDGIEDATQITLETWKVTWVADLERIKKLYGVKYDLPMIN